MTFHTFILRELAIEMERARKTESAKNYSSADLAVPVYCRECHKNGFDHIKEWDQIKKRVRKCKITLYVNIMKVSIPHLPYLKRYS